MAKMETIVLADFDELVYVVENCILDGSATASLEDGSDYAYDHARCAVRVFERFSMAGNNRVSMNVTFFEGEPGRVYVSAITSGGSQAMFFKVNTWGEETFLDKLRDVLDRFRTM